MSPCLVSLAAAPPWLNLDVLLVLVMALIAVIGRIAQAVRAYRKRTAAMERKLDQEDRVEFVRQEERGEASQEGAFARLREAFREPEQAPAERPTRAPIVPRGPVRLPLREPTTQGPVPIRVPGTRPAPEARPVPAPPRRRPRPSSAPATTERARARSTRSGISRTTMRLLSGNTESLREAIVLREILDLPPGLRGPWGTRLARRWTRG